jgi:hypothetical protein
MVSAQSLGGRGRERRGDPWIESPDHRRGKGMAEGRLDDGSEGSHDRCGEYKHGHRHGHVLTRVQHIRKHFHRPNIPAETEGHRGRETDRGEGRKLDCILRGERQREEERTDMNDPEAKAVTTPSRTFPEMSPSTAPASMCDWIRAVHIAPIGVARAKTPNITLD